MLCNQGGLLSAAVVCSLLLLFGVCCICVAMRLVFAVVVARCMLCVACVFGSMRVVCCLPFVVSVYSLLCVVWCVLFVVLLVAYSLLFIIC